jgi:hypothetical protein
LILIVFDESGSDENAGACCGELDGLGYADLAVVLVATPRAGWCG